MNDFDDFFGVNYVVSEYDLTGSAGESIGAKQAEILFKEIYPSINGVDSILDAFRVAPATSFFGNVNITRGSTIEINGVLFDEDNYRPDYKVSFSMNGDVIMVDGFHATRLEKRLGHGKVFAERLKAFAENAGIERIELYAASTEGGYRWAKEGLVPVGPEDWKNIKSFALGKLFQVKDELTKKYGREQVEQLQISIGKLDIEDGGLKKLAMNNMLLPDGEIVGKRLLAGSKWNAVCHIKSPS